MPAYPAYEAPGVKQSPEEELLAAFNSSAYGAVVEGLSASLAQGRSPNTLSVVRPDLIFGFAETFLSDETAADQVPNKPADDTRANLFDAMLLRAAEGDPAAISALPKFTTSAGQLESAMELTLDHREAVAAWRGDRPYIQLIGSFNPQHIGHRSTMSAALEAGGANSSLTTQVVADHPVKKDSLPPYEGRYRQSEYYTYRSSLIDPTRVTLLDVPVGSGLAKAGAAQIELLADVTGDSDMRWVVGSDKFMSDVKTARQGEMDARAIVRFTEPRMHLYVARRAVHELAELEEGIDFIRDRFDTMITLVDEAPSEAVLAASASCIRQLRSEGKDAEADRIQFADIPNRA